MKPASTAPAGEPTDAPVAARPIPPGTSEGGDSRMRGWRPILATILLLWAASERARASDAQPSPYTAIYSFGDCLTDTGNAKPSFPNWRGRWSNGPMWVETIATNLGLVYVASRNVAESGAATGNVQTWDLGPQVSRFVTPTNAASALFTVWAGPVDFYYHLGSVDFFGPYTSPTNDAVWNRAIANGTRNLSNAVVRLYQKGARSILIPNVDDVSRQPVVIRLHSETTRRVLRQRVEQFNGAIAEALAALDAARPDLRLVRPDAFALINQFIDRPADHAMSKTHPAAMQDPELTDRSLTGPGADYVFWDEYGHPTTKGHTLIAKEFLAVLKSARPERLRVDVIRDRATVHMDKLLIGRKYALDTSTDLRTWVERDSFDATAGTNIWAGALPNSGAGYFRLRWGQ